MAGRTAREILIDRERELASEVDSLTKYITTLEGELEDVRRAIEALGPGRTMSDNAVLSDSLTAVVIPATRDQFSNYENMTINELVLDALDVYFTEGASHAQLRQAFQDKYARTVEKSSLRSQLARLRVMGLVKEADERDVIVLTPRGAAQAQNERRQRMLRLPS